MDLYRLIASRASSSSTSLASTSFASDSPATTPDHSERSENGDAGHSLDQSIYDHIDPRRPTLESDTPQFILVIGGLGYIGSHTSLELLKAGYNVIIVDNLSNSYEHVYHRIKKLASDHYNVVGGTVPLIHFHKLDYRSRSMRFLLESYADLVAAPEPSDGFTTSTHRSRLTYQSRITGVIHFAASKSVGESISKPLLYYQNNVCGMVSLLGRLEDYGIRNFVFSSSATIYGSKAEAGRPLREEDLVHHPRTVVDAETGVKSVQQPNVEGLTSPYGRSKYFCEAILADLAASDPEWRITALRYFNPVGCESTGQLGEDPRSTPTNLFPVITQVMTGVRPRLDVYGTDYPTRDGTPVRDFIHVVDIARGHLAALKPLLAPRHRNTEQPPAFRAYNLGSGEGTTVLEAVRSLEGASGQDIPVEWKGRREGDVGICVASTERARTELGWTPRESIAQCAIDSWNYVSKLAGKDATSATGLASQPRSPLASASPSEHAQSPATPATTAQEAPSPTAAEFLLDAAVTAGSKTSAVPDPVVAAEVTKMMTNITIDEVVPTPTLETMPTLAMTRTVQPVESISTTVI